MLSEREQAQELEQVQAQAPVREQAQARVLEQAAERVQVREQVPDAEPERALAWEPVLEQAQAWAAVPEREQVREQDVALAPVLSVREQEREPAFPDMVLRSHMDLSQFQGRSFRWAASRMNPEAVSGNRFSCREYRFSVHISDYTG